MFKSFQQYFNMFGVVSLVLALFVSYFICLHVAGYTAPYSGMLVTVCVAGLCSVLPMQAASLVGEI